MDENIDMTYREIVSREVNEMLKNESDEMNIDIDSLNEDNMEGMHFSKKYIAARIISRRMHKLNELMSDTEHSLLFAKIDFDLLNMSVDITDNGDVLYMRSLYNSMLEIARLF